MGIDALQSSHPVKFEGKLMVQSVPKFTANLYCICLSIPKIYTYKKYRFAVNLGHSVYVRTSGVKSVILSV